MMRHLKGAAREGARAFLAGKAEDANPYRDSYQAIWLRGYRIPQRH